MIYCTEVATMQYNNKFVVVAILYVSRHKYLDVHMFRLFNLSAT